MVVSTSALRNFSGPEGMVGRMLFVGILLLIAAYVNSAKAELNPQDLLLVINSQSPTSCYIGQLYRQYYPGITDSQIVYLDGIPDSSGLASTANDEIISRADFNSLIAEPIRNYLTSNNMVNSTKAIITTAGLPYKIEDTNYSNIVQPAAAGSYSSAQIGYIDAASVESELAVLFQIDPTSGSPLPTYDRVVNPYQGYRSGIDCFERDILNRRDDMNWSYLRRMSPSHNPPMMEGQRGDYNESHLSNVGKKDRLFSAADIYLTCRLDGPKEQGQSAIFAVHDMLERSRRASSTEYGINAAGAAVILDDSPGTLNLNNNRIYNLDQGVPYLVYDPENPNPPDTVNIEQRDDFESGFCQMTGAMAEADTLNSALMPSAHGVNVLLDARGTCRTSQSDLSFGQAVVGLSTFGRNGDEGDSSNYLLNEGDDSSALFELCYGSVYASFESYNAVTLFSDIDTSQSLIGDFLEIGGSAALGHAFEPYSDAAIDTEFLFYNLLADNDSDGYADMTFLEAAFSALPYLSWSEVILGDPLMQIAYGDGGVSSSCRLLGDINLDGIVTEQDLIMASNSLGFGFGEFGYNDLADINRDYKVSYYDLWLIGENLGAYTSTQKVLSQVILPEPATIIMMIMGLPVVRARKKSQIINQYSVRIT